MIEKKKMGRPHKYESCDHNCMECKTVKCPKRGLPAEDDSHKESAKKFLAQDKGVKPLSEGKPAKEKKPTEKEILCAKAASLIKTAGNITTDSGVPVTLDNLLSLSKKDILNIFASRSPSREEANRLVKLYYQMQRVRIISASQVRAAEKAEESSYLVTFFGSEYGIIEDQIKKVLDVYTDHTPIGWVLKQICGIGPVISAGLVSGFDITKAKSAGGFWRYCGLDPTVKKVAGEKLKYNEDMKVLVVFKLGESFVKVKNNPNAIYSRIYDEWYAEYSRRNAAGEYVNVCNTELATKNFRDKDNNVTYQAYLKGIYPDSRIYNMAKRKPLMIFISHLFDLEFMLHYHKKSPVPYVIEYLNHVHTIENPLVKIWEDRFGPIPMDGIEQDGFGDYNWID